MSFKKYRVLVISCILSTLRLLVDMFSDVCRLTCVCWDYGSVAVVLCQNLASSGRHVITDMDSHGLLKYLISCVPVLIYSLHVAEIAVVFAVLLLTVSLPPLCPKHYHYFICGGRLCHKMFFQQPHYGRFHYCFRNWTAVKKIKKLHCLRCFTEMFAIF